jgi:hypothetical protein
MRRWTAPGILLLLALAAPGCCMTAFSGSSKPDYVPPYFFCCAANIEHAKWDPPILFMLPFDALGDLLLAAPITVAWIAGAYSRDEPEPEAPPEKPLPAPPWSAPRWKPPGGRKVPVRSARPVREAGSPRSCSPPRRTRGR